MSKLSLSLALSALLSTTILTASSDNMAESLMNLRADVEQLNSNLNDEKESYKASMKSLTRQKNDLEAIIAREDLKIKQLNAELTKVKKQITSASAHTVGLKPLVLKALDDLSANIQTSLPFKTNERLADVRKIKNQLENDLITPQKALAQTWNTYGDSIRMTKENGLFKQTIKLDNEDRLAQVARVGTMMMFFKTPDDRVGYVNKDVHGWNYTEVLSKNEKAEVMNIFDAFQKHIRTGYFPLPNALITSNNTASEAK